MKQIRIVRNIKLIDGEQYFDDEIIIETNKSISLSMIRKYNQPDKYEDVLYLQIGNFLEKDFQEYEITSKDIIWISIK